MAEKFSGHFIADTFEKSEDAYRYLVNPNSGDSHQTDPYWIAVVIPFMYKDTYNRTTQSPRYMAPVQELENIVIDNDRFVLFTH